MTRTLEKAIQAAKTLSEERQNQIGQWISDYVEQEQSPLQLTDEQASEVKRRLADPAPVFATDAQVEALFAKFAV